MTAALRFSAAFWLTLAPLFCAASEFDFSVLENRARALAAEPYRTRPSRVPAALQQLSYDERRDIRFRPAATFWRDLGLPFQLQFLHPGFNQTHTVGVSLVVDGKATPVPFDTGYFNYGKNTQLGPIPADMGFSGFRAITALNHKEVIDELIVFEGASYFRALGRGLFYGLSARGLAIDCGELSGEEFPVFEEFWVEQPKRKGQELVMYALLDSPRVAGAYRFAVRPGDDTTVDISATLYRRGDVKVFGVAPLTSMFWFGENTRERHGDLRPEVHDSDGLAMARGNGEWLWRPLTNPSVVRVASFFDENPRGFGLCQRDRRFVSYQDMEAHYHLRPSVWVEPLGDWGRGVVRLVELPTPDETNDNIVAFWVPETLPPIAEPLRFAYRLHWFKEGALTIAQPAGRVAATRVGSSRTHEPELIRFWIDFEGDAVASLSAESDVKGVVTVGAGATLVNSSVQRNAVDDTWRLAFAILPENDGEPVELRAFLENSDRTLTETWTYLWTP